MSRLIMFPYKMGSESAKVLAKNIGVKRVYANGRYKYRSGDIILNWGNSSYPQWAREDTIWINDPSAIAIAANKISTLHCLSSQEESTIPLCPEYTLEREVAESWIAQDSIVYCRKSICGKGGDGIVIATSLDEIVNAPLYTKGVANDKEYRVHVFNGEVIDFAKKGVRRSAEEENRPSHLVRNHTKGWIFIREGIKLPEVVKEAAIKAISCLGLTFGGVDVCTTVAKEGEAAKACVFEVNTAVGLVGQTIQSYKCAILHYVTELG